MGSLLWWDCQGTKICLLCYEETLVERPLTRGFFTVPYEIKKQAMVGSVHLTFLSLDFYVENVQL